VLTLLVVGRQGLQTQIHLRTARELDTHRFVTSRLSMPLSEQLAR
jgi:hypothetical protein